MDLLTLIQQEALESERCHLAQTLDGADLCGRCQLCNIARLLRSF